METQAPVESTTVQNFCSNFTRGNKDLNKNYLFLSQLYIFVCDFFLMVIKILKIYFMILAWPKRPSPLEASLKIQNTKGNWAFNFGETNCSAYSRSNAVRQILISRGLLCCGFMFLRIIVYLKMVSHSITLNEHFVSWHSNVKKNLGCHCT